MPTKTQTKRPLNFVDLFAGCGGLSLGLLRAGCKGLFAVESHADPFETYRKNLLHTRVGAGLEWPSWLPQEPIKLGKFLSEHRTELLRLRGKVDLVAGGPPCQGFSLAGTRRAPDPRNQLSRLYVQFVELVRPKFLLMENVRGFAIPFRKNTTRKTQPFSERVVKTLEELGYWVRTDLVHAKDYGVPQTRVRFILFGVHKSVLRQRELLDPFSLLERGRRTFLRRHGLSTEYPVSARQAISDMEIGRCGAVTFEPMPKFQKIAYGRPRTNFQRLMHGKMNGHAPNSLRIANHGDRALRRFKLILRSYRKGVNLSDIERAELGTGKQVVFAMDGEKPAHTVTSLPDDMIHYSEPRILTVRECARLQTFPDAFAFQGRYTTGGKRRRIDCPRYTQIANAVPPLLAEQLGRTVVSLDKALTAQRQR